MGRPFTVAATLLGCATTLVGSALLPAAARGQAGDEGRRHVGIGVGWVVPFGQVGSMTDLVQFSSAVAAKDLYKSCLAVHLVAGTRVGRWVLEGSMDARIPRLTDAGQAIVNQTHPQGGEVDVEYASFELFVGRTVPGKRLALFGGAGFGLALMQFSGGGGIEPHNDGGVGGSAKVGVDWFPSKAGRLAFRLAGRYQLFSAGVDLPHDGIVHALTMFRF